MICGNVLRVYGGPETQSAIKGTKRVLIFTSHLMISKPKSGVLTPFIIYATFILNIFVTVMLLST